MDIELAMNAQGGALRLARGQVLKLRDGSGSTVCASDGTVWITEENSVKDVVLQAGQCYRLERSGVALLQAFADASLSIN
jgi:hypothetical protein